MVFAAALLRGGSSPLTRGKPLRWRAGGRLAEAHPRSRGENDDQRRMVEHLAGSSPLTRGKPIKTLALREVSRLIPAHAGKTWTGSLWTSPSAAHPRSRGENRRAQTAIRRPGGSSPLTRGKHFLTCAFTAQIDQILETLELAASSGSYSIWVACATDAPQDQVRSIGLVLPSSRGAS